MFSKVFFFKDKIRFHARAIFFNFLEKTHKTKKNTFFIGSALEEEEEGETDTNTYKKKTKTDRR
jgi:hypothetical protein